MQLVVLFCILVAIGDSALIYRSPENYGQKSMITLKGTHLTQNMRLNNDATYKDKGAIREPFFIVVSRGGSRQKVSVDKSRPAPILQGLGEHCGRRIDRSDSMLTRITYSHGQRFSNCSSSPPTCPSRFTGSHEATITTGTITATHTTIVRSLNEAAMVPIVTMGTGGTIVNRRIRGIMGIITITITVVGTITVQMFNCIVSGLVSF
jgi:hypothetical protein